MKRTTIWFEDFDIDAIERIRHLIGGGTMSQAVRAAVRAYDPERMQPLPDADRRGDSDAAPPTSDTY